MKAAMKVAEDPDVSRRHLAPQPVMWALMSLAGLSLLVWLVTKSAPQMMLFLAIALAGVMDAIAARLSLADLRLAVQAPAEGVAGQDCAYYLQPSGLRRPVLVSRPGTWMTVRTPPVVIDSEVPGLLTLSAPPRGVIRYLVF